MMQLSTMQRRLVAKRAKNKPMKGLFSLSQKELEAVMNRQAAKLKEFAPAAVQAYQELTPLLLENQALQELGMMGHSSQVPLMETVEELVEVAVKDQMMLPPEVDDLRALLKATGLT